MRPFTAPEAAPNLCLGRDILRSAQNDCLPAISLLATTLLVERESWPTRFTSASTWAPRSARRCYSILAASPGDGRRRARISYPQPRWPSPIRDGWWHRRRVREAIAQADAGPTTSGGAFMYSPSLDRCHGPCWHRDAMGDQRCARRSFCPGPPASRVRGVAVTTLWTAPKLRWLVGRPEPGRRLSDFSFKDFIRHRLAGEIATDRSDGLGTPMFDGRDGDGRQGRLVGWAWRESCLTVDRVPGRRSGDRARPPLTGLKPGTLAVVGTGDAWATDRRQRLPPRALPTWVRR
jgi:hypothetical protein